MATATKAKALLKHLNTRTPTPSPNGEKAKITFKIEQISPEKAMEYLELKGINRVIGQRKVDKFARDMVNDAWDLTPQGIAFDWNGFLYDGEHRLWAIVQSGKTIPFVVSRGWDPDSRKSVDMGYNRTTKDVLEIMFGQKNLTKVQVSIAKRLLEGSAWGSSTRAEQVASYLVHQEAIESVMALMPKKVARVTHVSVLTPLVRAWYQANLHRKIERFIDVLTTGFYKEGQNEEVIILLRNYLMAAPTLQGTLIAEEVYQKVERAFYAYEHGEKLGKLYPAQKELYPLPGQTT